MSDVMEMYGLGFWFLTVECSARWYQGWCINVWGVFGLSTNWWQCYAYSGEVVIDLFSEKGLAVVEFSQLNVGYEGHIFCTVLL